jgi:O-antigen/teichoic acid export membrane protein
MSTRLLRRRAVTALGTYGGVVLGVLGTLVAARQLGPREFGLYALVLATTGFFQVLLDLTVEEAMVKFGFRYTAAGQYGRLRRLYRRALGLKCLGALIAGAVLAILAPFADSIFGAHGLTVPMLIAALFPITQVPEALAGAAIVLTGRYDVRGVFLFLTPAFRLAGIAIGSHYGVEEAVLGLLIGQIAASLAVGGAGLAVFRRFPAAEHEPLRQDRAEILRFVIQSSIATGIVSLRTTIAPLLLGVVTKPVQVGYFRVAQAPQTGLSALTSPARLILLTEQTRDWEAGSTDAVFAGVRRFTLGALVLMVVMIPPLYVFMPDLIRIFYGAGYLPAADAARIMLVAGGIQLVIAWTKSLPVSIGRPGLRIVTHGIETLVLIPLVLVFGLAWEVTGAAAAVLVSTVVFAAIWGVALARIRRETRAGRTTRTEPVTP